MHSQMKLGKSLVPSDVLVLFRSALVLIYTN